MPATPKRPTIFGFYVKNLSDGVTEPIAFLNLSLTQRDDVMTKHKIKEVHFINLGGTTAVRIRTEKQQYIKTWREIAKDLFAEASKTLGEDAVMELEEEISDKIKVLFREKERRSASSVQAFKRVIYHSKEIRQPSPLPGMLAPKPVEVSPKPSEPPKSFTTEIYTSTPLQYPQAVAYPPALPMKRPLEVLAEVLVKDPAKRTSDSRSKNPFQLKENHLDKLKDYIMCVNGQPWTPPSKYRAMGDLDDPASYQAKKRAHENAIPNIAETLMLLIPSIVRHKSYDKHLLGVNFTKSHKETLSKICALITGNSNTTGPWEGIYLLLPRPNMKYPSYGNGASTPQAGLTHMEAYRRILRMEEANETMTRYIDAAIRGGYKSLRLIAAKHLADAHVVLTQTVPAIQFADSAELILKIVPSADKVASPLAEQIMWLKDNRKCLENPYPVLTELDWGVPLLALFHNLLESMKRLENELEAQTVLANIMAFLDKRGAIYAKAMEPMLLYGARLAQHTTALQTLCFNFTGLGIKGNVPFTHAGRFHELDKNGKLLGADGRVNPLGLEATIPGREKWLLPFPIECSAIVADTKLTQLYAYLEEEKRLVASMLSDLNLQPGPPLLSYMAVGNANIKKLLSAGSIQHTSILPPSASMPSAWYAPDVVFAAE